MWIWPQCIANTKDYKKTDSQPYNKPKYQQTDNTMTEKKKCLCEWMPYSDSVLLK